MIDPELPLVDLHRHLDGNIRLSTILELAQVHNIELPAHDVEGLRPWVEIDNSEPGLMAFIARFKYLTAVLVDYEACRRVAYENVEDLAREGIDYGELRFSPWFMAEAHGLDPAALTQAVADGVAQGVRDTGVPCHLIGILSRTYGPGTASKELDALMTCRDSFVALDLAGDEANYPPVLFRKHFQRAAEVGWKVTVHAGEAAGPESVWEAIRQLGAVRIGHGIRSIEDPALVEYLRKHQIGLEVSLTSNVHTNTVASLARHPVGQLLDAGLLVNLNTDDPAISGIDLRHEYLKAAPAAGLSPEQIRQIQINGLEMAFLSDSQKQSLIERKKQQKF